MCGTWRRTYHGVRLDDAENIIYLRCDDSTHYCLAVSLAFAEEDEPARYIGGSNGHTAKINQALWGPCNTHIFSVSDDKTVRVWEVESESEVECITDHSKAVTSIEFSADKQMFITASSDHSARVRCRLRASGLAIFFDRSPFLMNLCPTTVPLLRCAAVRHCNTRMSQGIRV
jgi:WD40 repeat protein